MSKKDDIVELHQLIYVTGKTLEKVGKEIIFKPFGLTIPRFIILHIIIGHKEGKINTTQLQKVLNVSRANIAGRIKVLERDGLIRRKVGEDRREQIIIITAKGKKIVKQVEAKNLVALNKLYGVFSQKEIKQGAIFLDKILQRLNSKNCKIKK